jgi:ribonuclease BN (tRNA processing enzyme)
MTQRLFAPDGAFGPDLEARTVHPGSHFVYEARGGVMPRQRPEPQVREVAAGDHIDGGHWTVEVAEVVHVQPQLTCLAYRLTTPEGVIVFGGDTAPVDSLTQLSQDADVLLHMCHFINGATTDERLTSCCSGHIDAATTARDAGVNTLVLVHLTEQLETPGVRERVLHEVAEVFDGQVILAEDMMEVPMGAIQRVDVR